MGEEERRRELPAWVLASRDRHRALARALREYARAGGGGVGLGGGRNGGYDSVTLHWDEGSTSPQEITFEAALEGDRPVIQVTLPYEIEQELAAAVFARETSDGTDRASQRNSMSEVTAFSSDSAVVQLRGTGLPLVEPEQACEACGAQGTVGRAARFSQSGEPEIHRFCERCWLEESARLKARWTHADRRARDAFFRNPGGARLESFSTVFESATWDQVEEMIEQYERAPQGKGHALQEWLRRTADALRDDRANRIGPMPWSVAMYIRQYTTRELPPDFPND